MTRLTVSDKKEIANNAVNQSAIRERRKERDARRKAWAESVRLWINGDDEAKAAEIAQKIDKLLLEMPEGFAIRSTVLSMGNYKYVSFEGTRDRVCADWGDAKMVAGFNSTAQIPRGHALEVEHDEIEALDKAIKNDANKMRAQVNSVLNSVTTVAKLLKVWPECRELLPAGLGQDKVRLPAVPIKDLNAALGLPSDKARPTPPEAE